MEKIRFYKDRLAINVLAKDCENAKSVYEASQGYAIIGLLSKNYSSVNEAVEDAKGYLEVVPYISVGLGAGDPKQWKMALEIAGELDPGHLNQVFPTAFYSEGYLESKNCNNTLVNALISPSGEVGKVNIATGPFSSMHQVACIDTEIALMLMKDAGVKSIKFFHMQGIKHIDELRDLAEKATSIGIPVIEPTGGITVDNFSEIVKVCLDAGIEKVIPHVYTSIVDKMSGETNIKDIEVLYEMMTQLL